ncbi:hypothetical protein SAZ10_02375 [Mesorhizobium sp. BAC0120]|uniref:hypothetical protein n=1 Tax=Mesorhizobium sp. BAC0120 TaxID=3090670 RepID=UPI00298C4994|nr:hypothetical protein [Mesorhizobium sp. BAC0120]MDW6020603.1 hypothetical protein [Mesorhizobium sp. BAC0120]
MKSKLLALTAFSLTLLGAAPLAFAQTNNGGRLTPRSTGPRTAEPGNTSSISREDANPSSYLTDRNVRPFFTDGSMRTLRPEGELRQTFDAMSLDDRTRLRAACIANQNPRYNHLCTTVSAM